MLSRKETIRFCIVRLAKIILFGLCSFLFVYNSLGQDTIIDITSKSRKGYKDLALSVVDQQLTDGVWKIKAMGTYQDSIVGIQITIKDNLKPGIINGNLDNTSWDRHGVEIASIGRESDNFVQTLFELYGYSTEKGFSRDPVVFTCLSLNSQVASLEHGHYHFKLYFYDSNKSGIYSEIFFNANLPEGIVEFPDIDPIHFDGFLKAMIR